MIAVMLGGFGATPPHSNAPASMLRLPPSGRTWPRKSVFGARVYAVLVGVVHVPVTHGGTKSTVADAPDAGAQLPSMAPPP